MAKFKDRAIPDNEQEQQALDGQMQAAEDLMQRVDAVNQQADILQQERTNKTHDTEFSQYAEGVNGESEYKIIGQEEVEEAYKILLEYKESKAQLEAKLVENEKFWQLEHWEAVEADVNRIRPKSAWLVNTIINKHADAMDSYPEPNILPRNKDDEATAKVLSQVVPVILEQNRYQQTYSDNQWEKIKNGTGVQGVFWNNDKQNGLGDVDITCIDPMDIYWDMTVRDIQESPNIFLVKMVDNDEIQAMYPEIKTGSNILPLVPDTANSYANSKDYADKSAVIDWYYKRREQGTDEDGIPHMKTVLHYCKFTGNQVIYSSENDPNFSEKGWYNHGLYPFVFDVLFPIKRTAVGMGFIDLVKDNQLYTDKLRQAILENATANARPRWAVRADGGLNEDEFLDISNPLVHFQSSLGETDFRQITPNPLSSVYERVYLQQIEEMKQTSGNTAASQGQVSQVTSASGIASLQEASGKISRDSNSQSYDAYAQVVYLVIELIRQFYDEPRCFRISGDEETPEYATFDNSGLAPQPQGQAFGIDLGNRLPIMDIKVRPQKRSQYTKEAQNQTAMNLYAQGFFAPGNADAALGCLKMMDFDDIENVRDTIRQNGTMYEQIMQLTQQVQQLSAMLGMNPQMMPGTAPAAGGGQPTGKAVKEPGRGSLTSQAANATRESTAPR